jgi:hypothetical protein
VDDRFGSVGNLLSGVMGSRRPICCRIQCHLDAQAARKAPDGLQVAAVRLDGLQRQQCSSQLKQNWLNVRRGIENFRGLVQY